MQVDITIAHDAPVSVRDAIVKPLIAYNDSRAGPSGFRTLALILREHDGAETIGGLWAFSVYDWLRVDLLFVPERLRGQDLGTRLMRQAEAIAQERGHVGVWLDTAAFQALGFYQKLGYEVFGTLPDNPRGMAHYWLQKRF